MTDLVPPADQLRAVEVPMGSRRGEQGEQLRSTSHVDEHADNPGNPAPPVETARGWECLSSAAERQKERQQLEHRLGELYHLLREVDDLDGQRRALFDARTHRLVATKPRWRTGAFAIAAVAWVTVLVSAVVAAVVTHLTAWSMQSCTWPWSCVALCAATSLLTIPVALGAAKVTVGLHNRRVGKVNADLDEVNRVVAAEIRAETAARLENIDRRLGAARQAYHDRFADWYPQTYLNVQDVGECWRVVHERGAWSLDQAIDRCARDERARADGNPVLARYAQRRRAARITATRRALGLPAVLST